MRVRYAKPTDLNAMIKLVKEFFAANSFEHFGFSIDIASIERLVDIITKKHLMLILEASDKKIVGGVGGLTVPFLFNDNNTVFQELFFYIKIGFRRYSHLLMAELKKECKALKLDMMIMGYPCNGKADKLERFYKIKGFKKLETHFIARVNQ